MTLVNARTLRFVADNSAVASPFSVVFEPLTGGVTRAVCALPDGFRRQLYGERLVAAQDEPVAAYRRAAGDGRQVREAGQQPGEGDGCLQPCQAIADADVRAGAEAERPDIRVGGVEPVGARVAGRVAVGRADQQDQVPALGGWGSRRPPGPRRGPGA
jgi:hypothetical protein